MGGEMKAADILDALPAKVELDDWATETIESNGLTRRRTFVQFMAIF